MSADLNRALRISVFTFLILAACTYHGSAAPACPRAGDSDVTDILQPLRDRHGLPAMAAAIVTRDGLQSVGVVGVRKRGTGVPVTLNDKWHLGSCTKAMTAALVGRLVERERLKWDTPLLKVFPKLGETVHPAMKGVTVKHLLSHHAGLPANLDLTRSWGPNVRALRLRATREALSAAPRHALGTHMEYSNLGYILAGAVIERITGKPWEQVTRNELFTPLKMESAGFGGLGTPNKIDQPWGHADDGTPVVRNGPSMDNPPVMGPAGRVHGTIQDWARFITDQLRGARGEKALLTADTYRVLHAPPFTGSHAYGWVVTERQWGNGKVLTHTGCNTMNYANVWVAPKRNFAILVCTNQGGDTAFKATDQAVAGLIPLATKYGSR